MISEETARNKNVFRRNLVSFVVSMKVPFVEVLLVVLVGVEGLEPS